MKDLILRFLPIILIACFHPLLIFGWYMFIDLINTNHDFPILFGIFTSIIFIPLFVCMGFVFFVTYPISWIFGVHDIVFSAKYDDFGNLRTPSLIEASLYS